jgi:hypothetical protein
MQVTNDPFHNNQFIREWMLASTLALLVGTVLSWYSVRLGVDIAEAARAALHLLIPNYGVGRVLLSLPVYLATTTSVGTVIGLCMAVGQWIVLQRWVAWAREWLVASVGGALFSYGLMAVLNILAILFDPDPRLLKGVSDSGLWMGAIMGIAQWRVLRKHTSAAFWWILVSVGLWSLTATLSHLWGQRLVHFASNLLVRLLQRGFGIRNAGALRPFALVQLSMWVGVGAVWGLVAGKVLAWLPKKPAEEII